MASQREIENLIIRLTGDAASFKKMVADVEQRVQDLEKEVATAAEKSMKTIGKDTPQAYKKMADEAKKSFKEVKDAAKGADDQIAKSTRQGGLSVMTRRFSALGMHLKGYGATAAAIGLPLLGITGGAAMGARGVSQAAEFEQMELAFKTLVGDAGKAQRVLADIKKFAADTPFEMPELMAASKQMIAFGQDAATIVPTMRMLGDVSSGLGIPLGELTYLFGTLKSQGRAFTVDINQFAMRGIPIWAELEKQFGKTNQQVRAMVEGGQVKFEDVERAFKSMTGTGGRFANMMEEQSKTLGGLYSTMKDNMNTVVTTIGVHIIRMMGLKEIVQQVADAAESLNKWLSELPPGLATAITLLAVLFASSVALTILWPIIGTTVTAVVSGIVAGIMALFNPLTLVTVGVIAIKIAFIALLNPITWVVAAIVAFAALFILQAGGMQAAWDELKAAAIRAWEWMAPIRKAIGMFFETVKQIAQRAFEQLKEFAVKTWAKISQAADVDWNKVRDSILTAIFFAEFALINFQRAAMLAWDLIKLGADVAWASIKYYAIAALNLILANIHLILFVGLTGPAGILILLAIAFKDTFLNIVITAADLFKQLVEKIIELFAGIPEAIASGMKPSDYFKKVWTDFKTEFKFDLKGVKIKGLTDLEAKLRDEFNAAVAAAKAKGTDLMDPYLKDFEEFKKKRLAELGLADAVKDQVTDPIVNEQKRMADAVKAETSKFDAALKSSAEAIGRWQDYKDRLYMDNQNKQTTFQGGLPQNPVAKKQGGRWVVPGIFGVPGINNGTPVTPSNPGSGKGWVPVDQASLGGDNDTKWVGLLTDIRDILKSDSDKPAVVIETADLT